MVKVNQELEDSNNEVHTIAVFIEEFQEIQLADVSNKVEIVFDYFVWLATQVQFTSSCHPTMVDNIGVLYSAKHLFVIPSMELIPDKCY